MKICKSIDIKDDMELRIEVFNNEKNNLYGESLRETWITVIDKRDNYYLKLQISAFTWYGCEKTNERYSNDVNYAINSGIADIERHRASLLHDKALVSAVIDTYKQ